MRLWHQDLLPHLPRQQLLGQHRECCALRGAGWGRKHSVVNYVFEYAPSYLVAYHYAIMNEMEHRGYCPDSIWRNPNYRGKILGEQEDWCSMEEVAVIYSRSISCDTTIYPEHNFEYLLECLENLEGKGIHIEL